MTKTTVNAEEVNKLLNDLPDHLFESAKDIIRKAVFGAQRTVKKKFNGSPSDSLQSRTGDLSRSIRTTLTGSKLDNIQGEIYTKKIYAPIHETGGTIKAKRAFSGLPGGPYLAIPSDINKTKSGVTRLSVRDSFNSGGTYIRRINASKARFMIINNTTGPLFWLVKSVDIKARLGMVSAAEDEIPTLLSRLDDILLEGL